MVSVSLAIPIAVFAYRDTWFLPIAVLPLLMIRQLGTGRFNAQHDRARLRGLFEATLEINRSLQRAATAVWGSQR